MSPALIQEPIDFFKEHAADKAIFPDGFKTSGQQEPIYSLVKPYSKFPKEITGDTSWKAQDFKDNPEKWTYTFTGDEVAEISASAERFIRDDLPLTGITKVMARDPSNGCTNSYDRSYSRFPLWPLGCRISVRL